MAAPEAEGATAIDELDVPAGGVVGSVTALYHVLLVLPGHQVLAVVAPQAHGLRPVEQLHQLNSNTGKEWLGLEGRRRRRDKGFLRTMERPRLGFLGTVMTLEGAEKHGTEETTVMVYCTILRLFLLAFPRNDRSRNACHLLLCISLSIISFYRTV